MFHSQLKTTHRKLGKNSGIVSKGAEYVQYEYIPDERLIVMNLEGNILPNNAHCQVRCKRSFGNALITTVLFLDERDNAIAKSYHRLDENDDLSTLLNIAVNEGRKLL